MQTKKKVIILMIVALFCTSALAESTRSGSTIKDLGTQSVDFGSKRQAQALLDLIDSDQSKAEYRLFYKTEVDTVVFGCDFDKDVIVRIHQRKDDHGTQEAWRGYLLERLENAAQGGSLNDTPAGKKIGIYEPF